MNEYDTFFRAHTKMVSIVHKNLELEKECLRMERDIESYENEIQKIQKVEEGQFIKAKME